MKIKEQLKKYHSLENIQILIIFFPFLIFNWDHIANSPFYTNIKICYLFTFIILIDLVFKNLAKKLNYFQITGIYIILIVFLYQLYITSFIQNFLLVNMNIPVRGRTITLMLLFFYFLINIYFKKRKIFIKSINIFFTLFTMISLVFSIMKTTSKENIIVKENYIKFNRKNKAAKPVILIISDEYNSPYGLYSKNHDSSVFDFSNLLIKNKWFVKKKIF